MQDQTTWFRVVCFGQQAEHVSQYLTKGSRAYIEGRLRLEEWTDSEGRQRTSLEVTAGDIRFLDKLESNVTPQAAAMAAQAPTSRTRPQQQRFADGDIPF